jgi:hypothetical protein
MPAKNSASVLVAAGKLFTPAVDNVIEKLGESASLLSYPGVLKKNAAAVNAGCFSPPLPWILRFFTLTSSLERSQPTA